MDATAGLSVGRTLIIHIGDHKTGSTTIQHALAQGRVRLNGEAPFYGAALNHNDLPRLANDIDTKAAVSVFTALAANMAQSASKVAVLSAEEFESFSPSVVRAMLDRHLGDQFDRVRIVAYVRPHVQRLVSNYAEGTKIGVFSGDLEAYARLSGSRKQFLYTPRFLAWRKVFGDDFILRPAIRSEMRGGDILHDMFASTLGDVDLSIEAAKIQNESLCLEDLMRVKFLHACLNKRPKRFHHSYGWTLQRLLGTLPKSDSPTRIAIHKSLATQVGAFYRKDAVALDKAFFGAKPLMQDALQEGINGACPQAQPSDPTEVFSASELRSLTLSAKMISELLENNAQPWPKFLKNRRIAAMHQDTP